MAGTNPCPSIFSVISPAEVIDINIASEKPQQVHAEPVSQQISDPDKMHERKALITGVNICFLTAVGPQRAGNESAAFFHALLCINNTSPQQTTLEPSSQGSGHVKKKRKKVCGVRPAIAFFLFCVKVISF